MLPVESIAQVRQTMTPGSTSLLFKIFEQCHGILYVPFQLMCKDEGDKANGLTSPPNDAIIWSENEVSVTTSIWSHQFKTLVDCPAGVWTHQPSRPPTQQTGTLPTELTRSVAVSLNPPRQILKKSVAYKDCMSTDVIKNYKLRVLTSKGQWLANCSL